MVRRSSLIFAASLVVLSAFDPVFANAAAAPAHPADAIERPRYIRKHVKRFVWGNNTQPQGADAVAVVAAGGDQHTTSDTQSLTPSPANNGEGERWTFSTTQLPTTTPAANPAGQNIQPENAFIANTPPTQTPNNPGQSSSATSSQPSPPPVVGNPPGQQSLQSPASPLLNSRSTTSDAGNGVDQQGSNPSSTTEAQGAGNTNTVNNGNNGQQPPATSTAGTGNQVIPPVVIGGQGSSTASQPASNGGGEHVGGLGAGSAPTPTTNGNNNPNTNANGNGNTQVNGGGNTQANGGPTTVPNQPDNSPTGNGLFNSLTNALATNTANVGVPIVGGVATTNPVVGNGGVKEVVPTVASQVGNVVNTLTDIGQQPGQTANTQGQGSGATATNIAGLPVNTPVNTPGNNPVLQAGPSLSSLLVQGQQGPTNTGGIVGGIIPTTNGVLPVQTPSTGGEVVQPGQSQPASIGNAPASVSIGGQLIANPLNGLTTLGSSPGSATNGVPAGSQTVLGQGAQTLPNGSPATQPTPTNTEGAVVQNAATGSTLPTGAVNPSSPASTTLPNGQVVPIASATGLANTASPATPAGAGTQLNTQAPAPTDLQHNLVAQQSAPGPTSGPVATDQQFATNQKGPFTQQPTGYDANTAQPVPTGITFEPSALPPSTANSVSYGPTGLPSNVPLVLYPPTGPVKQPENTDLIQVGFLYPLNYDFVWHNPVSQKQIFTFLPPGIAYALGIDEANVTMQTLRAWDTTQDLHYITTLALAWIPHDLVNTLGLAVNTPSSKFYNNPDPSVRTLLSMVNSAIPIRADNGTDEGSGTGTGNPAASPSNGGAAPVGGNIGSSSPVKASSVGIGVGVVCGAAAYGAAMFFVARRYRKRRQSHMRSPSMMAANSPVMSHVGPDPAAAAALMSGAMGGERSISPYYDRAESRGSNNSGGSSGRQQISAPVMAENSLGWN